MGLETVLRLIICMAVAKILVVVMFGIRLGKDRLIQQAKGS